MIRGSALKAMEDDPAWVKKIDELMEAVDSYIPMPQRAVDKPFLMPIEDIFSISGRGTVVTGRIERGIVKVGEEMEIVGFKPTFKTVITGVEMFKKLLDEGQAGDNVGLLLRGTKKEEVERGQVVAKTGSITPHTKFKAEIYVLTKEEGGRHTPFFKGYRPQFYFRTTDVTGSAELPEGVEMVMPGDNVSLAIELITPVALEKGLRFAIREGGRTVGAGTVRRSLPNARHHHNAVYRLQRKKLLNHKKQKKDRQSVWKRRSFAHGAGITRCIKRRSKLQLRSGSTFWMVFLAKCRPVAPTGRAPVSKTGCWGFESLLACQHLFNESGRKN